MYKNLKYISNNVKYLAACTVAKAKSGHTGAPLGMADFLTVLFTKHLNFDVNNPNAINKDRFVLSNGHSSALLYSLLHVAGYNDCSIDDLKNFRQLNSNTAGHPESTLLKGVDVSTGPLGQGLATSVGLALAAKLYSNKVENIDNNIYVTIGDGCLAEGISHEALEFAAHNNLDNLIVLFDNNKISIDGPTSLYTSTNIEQRMQAYGFNVIKCDGHDFEQIDKAYTAAKENSNKPTIIIFDTIIGKGCDLENTNTIHGSPLNDEMLESLKNNLDLDTAKFELNDNVYSLFNKFHSEKSYTPTNHKIIDKTESIIKSLNIFKEQAIKDNLELASRAAMGKCLDITYKHDDMFISGSADLTPSNCTHAENMTEITPVNFNGNYIHYGIREHAMGAIANGINLFADKKINNACATFMAFLDYMKQSIRMAAIMDLNTKFILTHDSIGVGEDGPTHQPIEQLTALRATPNTYTFRPADIVETIECWQASLTINNAPSVFALSRQNLPIINNEYSAENKSSKGAYIVYGETSVKNTQAIIIATGSEVKIAVDAAILLAKDNINARVVSIPCVELFNDQTDQYKESILPKDIANRLTIEAGSSLGLANFVGLKGKSLAIDEFGKSAKAGDIYQYFKLNSDNAYNCIKHMI